MQLHRQIDRIHAAGAELVVIGSGTPNFVTGFRETTKYDGPLYVGSSAYLALAGPLGATGAILSLANTDPEGCIAALAGDMEAQRALLPGHRESRVDFPAGLKRRLARMAGTPAAVRAS